MTHLSLGANLIRLKAPFGICLKLLQFWMIRETVAHCTAADHTGQMSPSIFWII
jgi:hypothetical protein